MEDKVAPSDVEVDVTDVENEVVDVIVADVEEKKINLELKDDVDDGNGIEEEKINTEAILDEVVEKEGGLQVSNLTRNVKTAHLEEIFSTYGEVKEVVFQTDRKGVVSKTCANVIFRNEKDAEQAMIYLDGGQIDGNVIKISYILVSNNKRRRELSEEPREVKRPAAGREVNIRDSRRDNSRDRNNTNIANRAPQNGRDVAFNDRNLNRNDNVRNGDRNNGHSAGPPLRGNSRDNRPRNNNNGRDLGVYGPGPAGGRDAGRGRDIGRGDSRDRRAAGPPTGGRAPEGRGRSRSPVRGGRGVPPSAPAGKYIPKDRSADGGRDNRDGRAPVRSRSPPRGDRGRSPVNRGRSPVNRGRSPVNRGRSPPGRGGDRRDGPPGDRFDDRRGGAGGRGPPPGRRGRSLSRSRSPPRGGRRAVSRSRSRSRSSSRSSSFDRRRGRGRGGRSRSSSGSRSSRSYSSRSSRSSSSSSRSSRSVSHSRDRRSKSPAAAK